VVAVAASIQVDMDLEVRQAQPVQTAVAAPALVSVDQTGPVGEHHRMTPTRVAAVAF
jgi:hypothetical protein